MVKEIIYLENLKMNNCDINGEWTNGKCCCNCINQLELYKHPSNKLKRFKGAINETTKLFACKVPFELENGYGAIVFDKKHSICEMHSPKINGMKLV